jgi:prepilin-type N-terminal cleavage/methylation domain-containing protein
MKLHSTKTRPAFTLIELIVVISIIALLATITISAVFRLQSSQKESNTVTHLTKIQMTLSQQEKAARAQIATDKSYESLLRSYTLDTSGNYDLQRAKALAFKLQLRREFPQTYAEVRCAAVFPATDLNLRSAYGGKPAFLNAIQGNGTPDTESAALLFLILTQSKGGAATDPETIARTSTIDIGGKQMRVFVDEWGTPICFRRWARDTEIIALTELNLPPHVVASAINKDPDDPDGKLKANSGWAPLLRAGVTAWFTTPLPEVIDPFDGVIPFNGLNLGPFVHRGPFVLSVGRDKTVATEDDLYSFRIAQFQRGN